MIKRAFVLLLSLGVLFSALIGWHLLVKAKIQKVLSKPMPPVTISTTIVKAKTWQPYINSTGSLLSLQSIDIIPEVSGLISKIYFQSGEVVKTNDPIADINDQIDQATLKRDEAALRLIESTYHRQTILYKQHVISKSDYDSASSQRDQALALVQQDQVMINKKHILAPFSGKLGIRKINLGQYIGPGQTAIVSLQMLDPLRIQFAVTQQDLSKIKIGQDLTFTVDAYPDKLFKGKVTATNGGVDPNTRMLWIEGVIPNPDLSLYPGMYGQIKIALPSVTNVIFVPQTAVEYHIYGNTVYLIEHTPHQSIAKQIFVTAGFREGENILIEKGLKSGDEVVIAGQIKLFNNAPVVVKND